MKFHKDKIWSTYVKGKQIESSIKPRSCFSFIDLFNLLHMDLFGRVPIKLRFGKGFTLVIVDEFSRFTLVLFLRQNVHASEEIISLVKKNELSYDRKISQL